MAAIVGTRSLIAKYEKARACLSVMPNTLSVTADARSLHEPLFKEDLFADMPRLVHSLDLAAEDNATDAYRDLLREIDRAFQSFDHMAVRHGWLHGGETDPVTSQTASALDLPAFVASALPPDGRVPIAWHRDLEGLPGFDAATGSVRLTGDATQLRGADGRSLLYPGRSHPLTRRAVASVRASDRGRVSAARGDASLLATYVVETTGVPFRRVFALRLFPNGRVEEEPDCLRWTEPAEFNDPWPDTAALNDCAAEVGARLAAAFAAQYRRRIAQQDAIADAWLERTATELCGAWRPTTGDLFGTAPAEPDWRSLSAPAERLAAFAADPVVPGPQRRQACDALDRYRIRARSEPSPQSVRSLGLLMLVP
jgi:hypothetical protein